MTGSDRVESQAADGSLSSASPVAKTPPSAPLKLSASALKSGDFPPEYEWILRAHVGGKKNLKMAVDLAPRENAPIRAKLMLNLATLCVKEKCYKEATGYFHSAFDLDPTFTTAWNLFLCAYSIKDHERMIYTYERLITTPSDIQTKTRYVNLATTMLSELIPLADLHPSDTYLFSCALSNCDFEAAAAFVDSPVTDEDFVNAAWYHYVISKDFDKARMLVDQTQHWKAKVILGNMLYSEGKFNEARSQYDGVGNQPEALYNKALCLIQESRVAEAKDILLHVNKLLSHQCPEVTYQIAQCFKRCGDKDKAREWLNITSAIAMNDCGVVLEVGNMVGGETLERCKEEVRAIDPNYDTEAP